MKNKLLLIIASVILCASAKAQKISLLNNDENTEISQSSTTAYVQIRIPYIEISHFINGDDIYNVISSPILTPTLGKGEPMLPHYNKILEFENKLNSSRQCLGSYPVSGYIRTCGAKHDN